MLPDHHHTRLLYSWPHLTLARIKLIKMETSYLRQGGGGKLSLASSLFLDIFNLLGWAVQGCLLGCGRDQSGTSAGVWAGGVTSQRQHWCTPGHHHHTLDTGPGTLAAPATRATKSRVMGAGYAVGGAAVLFCVTPAVRSSVLSSFNAVGNVG